MFKIFQPHYKNLDQMRKDSLKRAKVRKFVREHFWTDKSWARHYFKEGAMYLRIGDEDKARVSFFQAIKLNPKDGLSVNNIGCIYLCDDKYRLAVHEFSRAIALLKGKYAQSYLGRAQAWAKLGETEKAEADFARAMKLAPDVKDDIEKVKAEMFDQAL
jgi:Flp pilus assembly protein TadD